MFKRYSGSDYVIALFILLVFGPVAYGYALSVMWAWFVVPTFGLPALSIPLAVGLAMTVRMVTNQSETSRNDGDEHPVAKAIAYGLLAPMFGLFLGWIVTLFI